MMLKDLSIFIKNEPSLCCFLSDIIFDVLCLIINNKKERKCMNGRYYVVANNLNQNVTQCDFSAVLDYSWKKPNP